MFGFLKQKLSDFGNKLKSTIVKEEETKNIQDPKEEIKKEKVAEKKTDSTEKEIKKVEKSVSIETKKEQSQKQEPKKIEIKKEDKKTDFEEYKQTTVSKKGEAKPIDTIKETPKSFETKKEIPAKEEAKPIENEKVTAPAKKVGLLGKLLGFGKNEEKATTQKPTPPTGARKTKEELAEELEKKMFEEIEEEIKKEEAIKEKIEPKTEVKTKPIETKEKVEIKPIVEEKKESKEMIKEETLEETLEDHPSGAGLKEEDDEAAKSIEQEVEIEKGHEEKSRDIHVKTLEEDKRELKANVGVVGGLKGFLFGGIEITEKQISDMLWDLELSLIESDVEADAAGEIVNQIKKRLVGSKVSAKNIDQYLQEQIKEILTEMMKTPTISILEEMKTHKPLIILILGPNGAGKTTSIAKLVHYLKKHKKTSIVAAADTFRAGAIHQIEEHARRLEVRVIKQQYGADPAAVAFDAIKAAEATNIDVVLIDSAGRQETNKNLMEELRKIERVAKPDLKLYVGEAYVGQTLLEQVAEFQEIVGIDGFILTKIDTDAKGGTAISLLYKTKKPILFVGTGQGYDDFKEFTPEFILERII